MPDRADRATPQPTWDWGWVPKGHPGVTQATRKGHASVIVASLSETGITFAKEERLLHHAAMPEGKIRCVWKGDSCMSKRLLVLVLLLSAVAAMAATTDSNAQQATLTSGIRTYLMPDLSFKSVFVLDMLPQPEALALHADNLVDPKKR